VVPFVLVNRSDEVSERKFASFGVSRNDGVQPSRQILCAQRIALRAMVRILTYSHLFISIYWGD